MAEKTVIKSSRPMSVEEHRQWQKVRNKMFRTRDLFSMGQSQLNQIIMISAFCDNNGISLPVLSKMPTLEKEFLETGQEIDDLTNAIHDAEFGYYGVVYKSGDFDLITQTSSDVSGLGFPALVVAAIGIVSFTTILARWVYLEHKVEDITKKYNDIIKKADDQLCSDPNSETCKSWKQRKQQNDYKRETTIVESIKSGIATAGKGLSAGLLLAVPLIAFSMFGSKK